MIIYNLYKIAFEFQDEPPVNRRSKIEIATRQLHIFMQLPVSFSIYME